jgi:hypothetical protein
VGRCVLGERPPRGKGRGTQLTLEGAAIQMLEVKLRRTTTDGPSVCHSVRRVPVAAA